MQITYGGDFQCVVNVRTTPVSDDDVSELTKMDFSDFLAAYVSLEFINDHIEMDDFVRTYLTPEQQETIWEYVRWNVRMLIERYPELRTK